MSSCLLFIKWSLMNTSENYKMLFFFSLASFSTLMVPLHFHSDIPEAGNAHTQTQWTSPLFTFSIDKYKIVCGFWLLSILGWITFSHELITTPSAWQLNLLLNWVLPRYAIIVNAWSNLEIRVKKEKTALATLKTFYRNLLHSPPAPSCQSMHSVSSTADETCSHQCSLDSIPDICMKDDM